MNALGNKRPAGLIIGLLVVVALALFVFRGCAGGNNDVPVTGGQTGGQPGGQQGQLGRAFAARSVDQNGCPVDRDDSFASNEPIYVGFERSQIPSGTEIFARLSREGQPLEDTRPITAKSDMTTCVWFVFRPVSSGFEPGSYQADLMINGNRAETVEFEVGGNGGNSGIFGGGNAGNAAGGNVRLGEMVTTDRVDQDGCPDREVRQFRSDQPVYVAFDRSQIPAGTAMYARLSGGGQTLENTKEIRADRDLDTCVWFVFETTRTGGLQPGNYQVQVMVNGDQGPAAAFSVR